MPAALIRRGFTVLKDQRTTVAIREEAVDSSGSASGRKSVPHLTQVLKGSRADDDSAGARSRGGSTQAALLDVPLVLSGHTHGGQVLLPGVGALAAREFPVLAGLRARAEHVALRQPRRRHGLRAGAHQLSA